jgi:hypothetical protein
MMDIEGLINDCEQSELHLPRNPFALPISSNSMTASGAGGGPTSDATALTNFVFPTISPKLVENSASSDAVYARKRSFNDVVADEMTTTSGRRPNPPGWKKSQTKGDRGRMLSTKDYPRRRALQACQICRTRKTKCDNERPNCGSCNALGVECSYNEAPASKYSLKKYRVDLDWTKDL